MKRDTAMVPRNSREVFMVFVSPCQRVSARERDTVQKAFSAGVAIVISYLFGLWEEEPCESRTEGMPRRCDKESLERMTQPLSVPGASYTYTWVLLFHDQILQPHKHSIFGINKFGGSHWQSDTSTVGRMHRRQGKASCTKLSTPILYFEDPFYIY